MSEPLGITANQGRIAGAGDSTERAAAPGELCACGRQARVVYITERWGEVGFCGIEGAGSRPVLPCPFCRGLLPHPTKCPEYRLRPCPGCDRRGLEIHQETNGDLTCRRCGRLVSSAE